MSKQTAKTSSKEVKDKKNKRADKAAPDAAEHRKEWRIDRVREPLIDKAIEEYGLEKKGKVAEKAARLDAHFRNTLPIDKRIDCVPDETKQHGCGFTGPETAACLYCGLDEMDESDAAALAKGSSDGLASEIAKIDAERIEPEAPEEPANEARLEELNRAVARVVEVQAIGIGNFWDLGDALLPIFQRQLYLQRRNDDGTTRYRGWTQFLAGEFAGQITHGHSYRVMDVAKKFDRATAIRIGVAKLAILVRAKDDALPRLLKAAETTTVKALEARAKDENALVEAGQRNTGRDERPASGKGKGAGSTAGRRAAVSDASARATARSDNAITVATTLGTVEIPLFVKGSSDKRARKLSDEPGGEEVFVNGSAARYTLIIGGDGGLVLRIVRRRVSA